MYPDKNSHTSFLLVFTSEHKMRQNKAKMKKQPKETSQTTHAKVTLP